MNDDTPAATAPDTIASAARDAVQAEGRAVRALDQAETMAGHLSDSAPLGKIHATVAVAESNLAVAHELRALRLTLAQQLSALRPQR